MKHRNPATVLGAALIAASLWLTTSAQSVEPHAGTRTLVSDASAGAIDRGLRDADPPRDPRTFATELASRARREPYVPGSIIVKFRDGTAAPARTAMLSRVGGVATRA